MTDHVFAIDATYRRRNVALLLAEQNPTCHSAGGFTLYKCGVYFHYAPLGHYPIWLGTADVVRGIPIMRVGLSGGKTCSRSLLMSEKEMTRPEMQRALPMLTYIERYVMDVSAVPVRNEAHVERDGFNRRHVVGPKSARPGHDDYFAVASGF